jgi:hypothetical protein
VLFIVQIYWLVFYLFVLLNGCFLQLQCWPSCFAAGPLLAGSEYEICGDSIGLQTRAATAPQASRRSGRIVWRIRPPIDAGSRLQPCRFSI